MDTNILVYAHREDSEWHVPARAAVVELAESGVAWALPWPVVHEFLAIVTHPRIYKPPTPFADACRFLEGLMECPGCQLIGETDGYWLRFREMAAAAKVVGGRIHDARIAAVCLHHGVNRLMSADRDHSRFPQLDIMNPLLG